jgi:hypothetical protein
MKSTRTIKRFGAKGKPATVKIRVAGARKCPPQNISRFMISPDYPVIAGLTPRSIISGK